MPSAGAAYGSPVPTLTVWRRAGVRVAVLVAIMGAVIGLVSLIGFLFESGDAPWALVTATVFVLITTVCGVVIVGLAWVVQAFVQPTPPDNDGPPRGRVLPFRAVIPDGRTTAKSDEDRPGWAARSAFGARIRCSWVASRHERLSLSDI